MALNYIPISSSSDIKSALKQIDNNFRAISAENQTKTISQSGGNALLWGRLPSGKYGIILSDPSNNRRIFIGFKSNGEPNISVSKPGVDVMKALGEE